MIVHNTDSVFFTFNLETLDGEKVRGKKALEITIDLAQEAGELATKFLKKPHDLEYEKTGKNFFMKRAVQWAVGKKLHFQTKTL